MSESVAVEKIRATLPFLKELWGVKPYRVIGPLPPDREKERTNIEVRNINDIEVQNARVDQSHFSVDEQGFEFVSFTPQTPLVGENDDTAREFLNEITTFLQTRFETSLVFPYDLRIRSSEKTKSEDKLERMIPIPPAPVLHTDLTRDGAMSRIARHLHQDEQNMLSRTDCRVLVINTWMPLDNPAIDIPLVIGDRRTFDQEDVIPADQVAADFLGEYSHPRHRPGQLWYWLDKQEPGEMTIFCSFDSEIPGDLGGCPHGAFHSPLATQDAPRRKSVETRSIVIVPPKFTLNGA